MKNLKIIVIVVMWLIAGATSYASEDRDMMQERTIERETIDKDQMKMIEEKGMDVIDDGEKIKVDEKLSYYADARDVIDNEVRAVDESVAEDTLKDAVLAAQEPAPSSEQVAQLDQLRAPTMAEQVRVQEMQTLKQFESEQKDTRSLNTPQPHILNDPTKHRRSGEKVVTTEYCVDKTLLKIIDTTSPDFDNNFKALFTNISPDKNGEYIVCLAYIFNKISKKIEVIKNNTQIDDSILQLIPLGSTVVISGLNISLDPGLSGNALTIDSNTRKIILDKPEITLTAKGQNGILVKGDGHKITYANVKLNDLLSPTDQTCITTAGSNLLISDSTLSKCGTGVLAKSGSDGVMIRDTKIEDTSDYGIYIESSAKGVVLDGEKTELNNAGKGFDRILYLEDGANGGIEKPTLEYLTEWKGHKTNHLIVYPPKSRREDFLKISPAADDKRIIAKFIVCYKNKNRSGILKCNYQKNLDIPMNRLNNKLLSQMDTKIMNLDSYYDVSVLYIDFDPLFGIVSAPEPLTIKENQPIIVTAVDEGVKDQIIPAAIGGGGQIGNELGSTGGDKEPKKVESGDSFGGGNVIETASTGGGGGELAGGIFGSGGGGGMMGGMAAGCSLSELIVSPRNSAVSAIMLIIASTIMLFSRVKPQRVVVRVKRRKGVKRDY